MDKEINFMLKEVTVAAKETAIVELKNIIRMINDQLQTVNGQIQSCIKYQVNYNRLEKVRLILLEEDKYIQKCIRTLEFE
jgi:hypothetical protein